MPAENTTPNKSTGTPNNSSGNTTGTGCRGQGRGGHGGGRGNQGRGNNQGQGNQVGRGKIQQSKITVPAFEGMYKKDLSHKIIIYSESQASISAQWVKFENVVYNDAGRVGPMVARAIETREIHQLGAFLRKPIDPAEYNLGRDKQGNTIFNAA